MSKLYVTMILCFVINFIVVRFGFVEFREYFIKGEFFSFIFFMFVAEICNHLGLGDIKWK